MLDEYILTTRYFTSGESTYAELVERVSRGISSTDEEYHSFLKMLNNKYFLPGGRTLSLAGTNGQLIPNCVVLPIEDSISKIFKTLKRSGILQQAGCGMGYSFSKLRPAGMDCSRTSSTASGPISFMNLFSDASRVIQQKGRSGANIGVLDISHPDIVSFIHAKSSLSVMNNFNISVLVSNEFMQRVVSNDKNNWICTWNGTELNPRLVTYNENMILSDISPITITPAELFDEIIDQMWRTGEPGILFGDNINSENELAPYLGNIDATNPCGEICLYPNECCNLGSINLEEMCDESPNWNPVSIDDVLSYIKIDCLYSTTKLAIDFLNNVIDKLNIPDKKLSENVLKLRRIGLGIMGLADMFIKLRIPYDTQLARDVCEYIMQLISQAAHEESELLVSKYKSVGERLNIPILLNRSNCACTCIAPTGSTSMIYNVSSGIEPYYGLTVRRLIRSANEFDKSKEMILINKHLEHIMKLNNIWSDENIDKLESEGIDSLNLPNEVKQVFKTSLDIKPIDHVLMQASAQQFVDNSISKTINFRNNVTKSEIRDAVLCAWKHKCKGITAYRNGSRENQVFSECKNGKCDL